MRILVLGGTAEARELAQHLVHRPATEVISSLAGRVTRPALPVGEVRIGGFGGVPGLVDYLREAGVDRIVDATHPFAATITRNAAAAAAETGVPLLILRRPGWTAGPEDDWHLVPDIAAAAAAVAAHPARQVFLTTGRRDLAAFAGDADRNYLVRTVDPPEGPVPHNVTLVLDRGPYTVGSERALMLDHRVELLVTKNSGGPWTQGKLDAARELHLPVIMVERPGFPQGVPAVGEVATVLAWLETPTSA